MTQVKWIPQLQPHEWPDGVIDQMSPRILMTAVRLRQDSGVTMIPSPIPEAHVRQSGGSRHSTKGGLRLSDATDFFIPSRPDAIIRLLQAAQRIPEIGGLGIYWDTKPSVMIHIDGRPERIEWLRVGGAYIYLHRDPSMYYAEMASQLENLR